jgi:hypothetical protein
MAGQGAASYFGLPRRVTGMIDAIVAVARKDRDTARSRQARTEYGPICYDLAGRLSVDLTVLSSPATSVSTTSR